MAVSIVLGVARRRAGRVTSDCVDGALMRLTDLFLSLPLLPVLLVVIVLFRDPIQDSLGDGLGIFVLMVVIIGGTSWMQTARIVRGEVLTIKEQEFILASRSIGTRSRRIIIQHILPNVLSPVIVAASLGIAVGDPHRIGGVVPRSRLPTRAPDLGPSPERSEGPHQRSTSGSSPDRACSCR